MPINPIASGESGLDTRVKLNNTIAQANKLEGITPASTTALNAEEAARIAADALALPKSGGVMTGTLNMSGQAITNLPAPATGGAAANKTYVDGVGALQLSLTGGTMSGTVSMAGQAITNLPTPAGGTWAVPRNYVDDATATEVAARVAGDALALPKAGGTMSGALNVIAPTVASHATRKDYVDAADDLAVPKAGGTMTGALNVITPTVASHATRKDYVDAADALALLKAGGVMSGTLNMAGQAITNLPAPATGGAAANKTYVDGVGAAQLSLTGGTMAGTINMGGQALNNLPTPAVATAATPKSYVDAGDAAQLSLTGGTMAGTINMGQQVLNNLPVPASGTAAATKNYVDAVTLEVNRRAELTPNTWRPGDAQLGFTSSLAAGDPAGFNPISSSLVIATAEGAAIRAVGPTIIARRAKYVLEDDRKYRLRGKFRLAVDSIDEPNDTVRTAIAWYDYSKTPIAGSSGLTIFNKLALSADWTTVTVDDGWQDFEWVVSRQAGTGVDIVAPASARFATPYWQTYGASPQAAELLVLDWQDITDAEIVSPDVELLLSSGVQLNFDTGTSAANPGSGRLRFNNATPASVTAIYAHETDRFGFDISAWLGGLDDGGSVTRRGELRISQRGNEANYVIYAITGSVLDAGSYNTISVQHIAGVPAFTADMSLLLSAVRDGPAASEDGMVWLSDFGVDATGNETAAAANSTAWVAALAAAATAKRPLGVFGNIAVMDHVAITQADVTILGFGTARVFRAAASTASFVGRISGENARVEGIDWDGNKANNAVACNALQVVNVGTVTLRGNKFRNAKNSGGLGSGLQVNGIPASTTTRYVIEDNVAENNDGAGIDGIEMTNGSISRNFCRNNTGSGIAVANLDTTLVQKLSRLTISENNLIANGGSGLVIGNFLEDNVAANGNYGPDNPETSLISVTGNIAVANGAYGIAALGDYLTVSGNVANANSADISFAGIYFGARYSTLTGNTANGNVSRGFECGGSFNSEASNNVAFNNGNVGANLGGCRFFTWRGGVMENNGAGLSTSAEQISIHRFDVGTYGFDWEATDITVTGVRFILTGSQRGVRSYDGIAGLEITNNRFTGGAAANYLYLNANDPVVSGNRTGSAATLVTPDGAGYVYVPDVYAGEEVHTNSTATVTLLEFYSAFLVGQTNIAWINTTSMGTGYSSGTTATFSGGTGSGAVLVPIITADGRIVGIRVQSPGTYTVAPTGITLGNVGSGTGATFTLQAGLPLGGRRTLNIYSNLGQTFNALSVEPGAPQILKGSTTGNNNTVVSPQGSIALRAFGNNWRVKYFN